MLPLSPVYASVRSSSPLHSKQMCLLCQGSRRQINALTYSTHAITEKGLPRQFALAEVAPFAKRLKILDDCLAAQCDGCDVISVERSEEHRVGKECRSR